VPWLNRAPICHSPRDQITPLGAASIASPHGAPLIGNPGEIARRSPKFLVSARTVLEYAEEVDSMMTSAPAADAHSTARANIVANSQFDVAYVVMNGLATIIACYGLFSNSPAVVIGAMIIAMLLGPISGIALGLVDQDNTLLLRALGTLCGGIAVVYITAFVLGLVHRDLPLTAEIYARTSPNLMDLMIGLSGGAAGAYAMISPRLSVAFVGVAIATALVPPFASSAVCFARGEFTLAFEAFLLALTNIVAIQVASSLVMWLGGFRGAPNTRPVSEFRRNLLSVVLLGTLAVFLAIQFRRVTESNVYEASVRTTLNAAATDHTGAYLTDLRVQKTGDRELVVAVYRTPTPFTPADVAALEPKIPRMRGASELELRIRSVPVTVASRSGYIFSSDVTDHLRSQ
jgi:uncharacterized hydrophobic protein (TIGR00271 family)